MRVSLYLLSCNACYFLASRQQGQKNLISISMENKDDDTESE